jgi:hypothetical protein
MLNVAMVMGPLRKNLILDLYGRAAGTFTLAHGTHQMNAVPKSGVAIDEHRDADAPCDRCGCVQLLGHSQQWLAEPESCSGYPSSGHHSGEAHILNGKSGQRIPDARRFHRLAGLKQLS